MKKLLTSTVFSLTLLATNIHADEIEISPVVVLGVTYGGDTLADVELDDFPDEKIKAGNLFYIGGGVNFKQPESPWSIQANLAYHFDYTEGDLEDSIQDIEVTFDRIVVELIPYYQIDEKQSVGVGIFKAFDTEFLLEIENAPDTSIEFDSDTGFLAEWGYHFSEDNMLSVRYAYTEFEAKDTKNKFDGDYIGAFVQWRF
ncbi:outer membrane beta-barrel protein [Thalassotalea euphylliae]|uniref:outer membrane beta-barrel protein n=1 Tax=Thalassotalea euphylliae TaxID=1655234 RepID=UPI003636FECA